MSVREQYSIAGATATDIATSVEAGVREGRIHPGTLLPTVRGLAGRLEVSPATVAAAYRRLRARGFVTAHGRRGTRVAHRPPVPARRLLPAPPGLRDLAEGNPDPALLPPLRSALHRVDPAPRLYGLGQNLPELLAVAGRDLEHDGIRAGSLAVMGGALDGIERVLQAYLRPGDRVAVEDPGYTAVLDLIAALGLAPEPVALDDLGPRPEALAAAVRAGASAFVLTPRAQNPSGAALDPARARDLRKVLRARPEVLLIEDDHAGPIAGAEALTLGGPPLRRWAVVRSVSKWLGPDLRLAVLAGDPETVARVEGRQQLGAGWVSHVLQRLVCALWADPRTPARLEQAARAYTRRRQLLLDALARHRIRGHGRSGLNVWIPVPDEAAVAASLAAAGWAVRGAEPYRLASGPAIRVTVSTLQPAEASAFAADLSRALTPAVRSHTA